MLRVAVISDSRRRGGAALSAARLFEHETLRSLIQSQWMVSQDDGTQDEATVVFSGSGRLRRVVRALVGNEEYQKKWAPGMWSRFRNRRNLLRLLRQYRPAVISIHSINQWTDAALRRTVVQDLCGLAPVVWTLHDMWPLTGYADYPDEYVDPAIAEEEAFQRVFGREGVRQEARRLASCGDRLVWVAPSRWMGGLAIRTFDGTLRVEYIPHGVDLESFRPLPQEESRRWLDIPTERPVIVAAAHSLRARRKGMAYLADAIARLDIPVTLALIGHSHHELVWPSQTKVVPLGYLADVRLLRAAYSAADVFVIPSLAEMFGLVAIEALACGTPCAGFRTGGITEIIRPGITGELADRGNSVALAAAIRRLLALSPEQKTALRAACRRVAEQDYNLGREARCYADLFAELGAKGWYNGAGYRLGN